MAAGLIPLGYQSGVYDAALMGILQDCVKLPQFLDTVFSFLARRTDFYVIMEHEKAKMGFVPGVAEGMVLQVPRATIRLTMQIIKVFLLPLYRLLRSTRSSLARGRQRFNTRRRRSDWNPLTTTTMMM